MSVAKSANRTLLISRFPSDSSASMPVDLKNTRFFIYYDYNLEYRLQARFYKKGYLSEQKYPTNGRCKRWRLSSNYDKNNAFQLYAFCIMSNHVHYLIEPNAKEDLPKIMHFLNWYTAMCFNRMLDRTGHFWEKRYYCDGFPLLG